MSQNSFRAKGSLEVGFRLCEFSVLEEKRGEVLVSKVVAVIDGARVLP